MVNLFWYKTRNPPKSLLTPSKQIITMKKMNLKIFTFLFISLLWSIESTGQFIFSINDLEVDCDFLKGKGAHQCKSLANENGFFEKKLYSDKNIFYDKTNGNIFITTDFSIIDNSSKSPMYVSFIIKNPTNIVIANYEKELKDDYYRVEDYYKEDNMIPYTKNGRNIITIKKTAFSYEILVRTNPDKLQGIPPKRISQNTLEINSYVNENGASGIIVRKGDRISFKAKGSIVLGTFAGSGGPDGISGLEGYSEVQKLKHGSLIGKIGDGDWFSVGSYASIVAQNSGKLTLQVNDNDPSNNEGSFIVEYSINKPLSSPNPKYQPQQGSTTNNGAAKKPATNYQPQQGTTTTNGNSKKTEEFVVTPEMKEAILKSYYAEEERLNKLYKGVKKPWDKSTEQSNNPSYNNSNYRNGGNTPYTPTRKTNHTFDSRIGLRGGLNLASIKSGTETTDILLGYHAGLMYNIPLSKTFSIQPELSYTAKGAKDKASTDVIKMPMVELPVLLKCRFGGSDTKFFVNGGGYGAYVLNVDGVKPSETTIEYGAVGGVGIEFPAGEGKLLIEGRYNYGLGYSNKSFTSSTDFQTTAIGISLGYFY